MHRHVDDISRADFKQLVAEPAGGIGISIYLPTGSGADSLQVREFGIQLKNLVRQAEETLTRYYRREQALLDQLSRLRELVDDEGFWREQAQGLAIFLSAGQRLMFRVYQKVEPEAQVGNRFYLLPLLPALSGGPRFYVLGISAGTARLFTGDQMSLREMTVDDMPASQQASMWFKESERTPQRRDGAPVRGGRDTVGAYHGQGEDVRAQQADLEQYLRQVDQAVVRAIDGHHAPLVLAGSEPALGHFRQVSSYPLLLGPSVDIKPETADPAALHAKSLRIVEQQSEDPAVSLMHQYHWYQANQPERVTSDPNKLAEAAGAGRVEHLLIAADALSTRGAFGEQLAAAEGALEDIGLLNQTALETLQASGDCVVIGSRRLLAGAPAAAILRY